MNGRDVPLDGGRQEPAGKSSAGTLFRPLPSGREAEVCAMIERVFREFVAPGYSDEGVAEFLSYASEGAMRERLAAGGVAFVAEEGDKIVGMIEMRNVDHIALLFVERRRAGIATELLRLALEDAKRRKPDLASVTVNSSPYAESVYHRLGFRTTGETATIHGITFVPMTLPLVK